MVTQKSLVLYYPQVFDPRLLEGDVSIEVDETGNVLTIKKKGFKVVYQRGLHFSWKPCISCTIERMFADPEKASVQLFRLQEVDSKVQMFWDKAVRHGSAKHYQSVQESTQSTLNSLGEMLEGHPDY